MGHNRAGENRRRKIKRRKRIVERLRYHYLYDGLPSRNRFHAVTDETGVAYIEPNTPMFGLAIVFFADPRRARRAVLNARVHWATKSTSPEDQKAVTRGHFHAKDDSTATREYFFNEISRVPLTIWYDTYNKDAGLPPDICPTESKPKTGKFLYHGAIESIVTGLYHTLCHEAVVGFAEHRDFMKDGHLAGLRERIHNAAIHSFAEHPHDPSIYTVLTTKVLTPMQEPLLDVADYCMWAIQRSHIPADKLKDHNPPQTYLKQGQIKLQASVDLADSLKYFHLEHYFIGRDVVNDSPLTTAWDEFLKSRFTEPMSFPVFSELERCITVVPRLVVATLPRIAQQEYDRLRTWTKRGIDRLTDNELVEFSLLLLTLIDTVPLIPLITREAYNKIKEDLAAAIGTTDELKRQFANLIRSWQRWRAEKRQSM